MEILKYLKDSIDSIVFYSRCGGAMGSVLLINSSFTGKEPSKFSFWCYDFWELYHSNKLICDCNGNIWDKQDPTVREVKKIENKRIVNAYIDVFANLYIDFEDNYTIFISHEYYEEGETDQNEFLGWEFTSFKYAITFKATPSKQIEKELFSEVDIKKLQTKYNFEIYTDRVSETDGELYSDLKLLINTLVNYVWITKATQEIVQIECISPDGKKYYISQKIMTNGENLYQHNTDLDIIKERLDEHISNVRIDVNHQLYLTLDSMDIYMESLSMWRYIILHLNKEYQISPEGIIKFFYQ